MKDPGDNGKPQLGFLLQNFGKCLWPLARLTAFGANSKYKPFDWRERDDQYFIDKLSRHWMLFLEDPYKVDRETGELHIVAVVFHGLCLIYKLTHQMELEYPATPEEALHEPRSQPNEDDLPNEPLSFDEWTGREGWAWWPRYRKWHNRTNNLPRTDKAMQKLYQQYLEITVNPSVERPSADES